jgi:hypothetical protein
MIESTLAKDREFLTWRAEHTTDDPPTAVATTRPELPVGELARRS